MPEVFVSYCQADRECALEIVTQLEKSGFSLWIAPRDISPSADWAAEIIDAIAAARLMVLVFSAACNISPQVRREVERAVHRQLPILPFRVEAVLPTKSLEYFLSAQHWLDAFPPPLAPHYERLCQQVGNILRAGVTSVRVAPPSFSREELLALQETLAEHIGPLSAYLVNHAAASSANWNQLIETLAPEIDSPGARQHFIESNRRDFPR